MALFTFLVLQTFHIRVTLTYISVIDIFQVYATENNLDSSDLTV